MFIINIWMKKKIIEIRLCHRRTNEILSWCAKIYYKMIDDQFNFMMEAYSMLNTQQHTIVASNSQPPPPNPSLHMIAHIIFPSFPGTWNEFCHICNFSPRYKIRSRSGAIYVHIHTHTHSPIEMYALYNSSVIIVNEDREKINWVRRLNAGWVCMAAEY